MPEDKVTAHGRELGNELRRRRAAAGFNGKDMAARLGWSPTKVSRVEVGARSISETDLVMYLASCGLSVTEIDPILDLAREGTQDHRLKAHGEKLPDELKTLIFLENTAAEIHDYELLSVPGLTQTEDYIRAFLQEYGTYVGESIEFRVQARLERQQLLRRSTPPYCRFFVHENALRTVIGSPKIMLDQLLHLVFVTGRRYCEIRVVPASSGGRGLALGSFRLMKYAEIDPVVNVKQEAVSLFLDRPNYTEPYLKRLERLDQVALDEEESRRVLADLASEFERSSEEYHGA